jgi:hypothetical protein
VHLLVVHSLNKITLLTLCVTFRVLGILLTDPCYRTMWLGILVQKSVVTTREGNLAERVVVGSREFAEFTPYVRVCIVSV